MKYEHLRFYAMIYATKDANDKWKGNLFFFLLLLLRLARTFDPRTYYYPLLNGVKAKPNEKKNEVNSNQIASTIGLEMKSNIIPYLFGVKVSRIRP